jgi:hypothetical protein
LVAWYNTEIQRATNFDVIESYLLDMNAGVLYPENATATVTGQKLHVANVVNIYTAIHKAIASVAGAELVLRVTGLSSTIRARAVTIDNKGLRFNYPLTNGVNKIPGAASGSTSFILEGLTAGACDITIEQLPTSKLTDLSGNGHHLHLYGYTGTPTNGINTDGWLQSAGVGYGVSYGQPILTDYTVCSTRKWNATVPAYGLFANKPSSFMLERTENSVQYAYSFNAKSPITFEPGEFTYQSSASYNGTPITKGKAPDADTLILGRLSAGSGTRFDGSYKSFVLFNRTLTTEELAYVERWMA